MKQSILTMSDPNVHHKKPYRLPGWASLTVFSVVVLAAMNSRGYSTGAEKWVIALSSISLTFSLFATVAYLIPDTRHMFIGEKTEVGLALFLLVLWCVGLPIIMDPSRSIAVSLSVNGLSYVWNANLYFFSWASFICIAYISGSLAKENVVGVDEALSSITPKLGKWYMFIITSVVVLASASQFQKSQCSNDDSDTCTSNKYAISLGAVAIVFGLAISILGYMQSLSIYIETGTALLMFIMYTAGVGVITFDFGPGVTIGNLYFSTWGGFVITIFLLVECYEGVTEMSAHGITAANTNGVDNKQASQNEIQVEAISEEDDI